MPVSFCTVTITSFPSQQRIARSHGGPDGYLVTCTREDRGEQVVINPHKVGRMELIGV
jgi:hypothetical protein